MNFLLILPFCNGIDHVEIWNYFVMP